MTTDDNVSRVRSIARSAASTLRRWLDPPLDADSRPLEIREAIVEQIAQMVEPAAAGRRVLPRHHVTAVKDGDEALALLKRETFDLVLADRHLPGTSGLRVIEHAQRLLPHCASVLYTAYPSYDSVKEAFATGVDAFLVRPSEDLKKLAEKVAEALGGRGGILLG